MYTDLDKAIGYKGPKKYKITDFIKVYNFRGALLDKLANEEQADIFGLKWVNVSFLDRRIAIELSYELANEDAESGVHRM